MPVFAVSPSVWHKLGAALAAIKSQSQQQGQIQNHPMQHAARLRALARALAADGCPARASWQAAQVRTYASPEESKSWIPEWLRSKLPGVAAVLIR